MPSSILLLFISSITYSSIVLLTILLINLLIKEKFKKKLRIHVYVLYLRHVKVELKLNYND